MFSFNTTKGWNRKKHLIMQNWTFVLAKRSMEWVFLKEQMNLSLKIVKSFPSILFSFKNSSSKGLLSFIKAVDPLSFN